MDSHNNGIQSHGAQIKVSHGMITDVNEAFSDFTGYTRDQLVSIQPDTVLNDLLKASVSYEELLCQRSLGCFIFTQMLEAREVSLSISCENDQDEYVINLREKPGTRLESRFAVIEKLFSDNQMGICILSVPGLNILKANDRFFNLHQLNKEMILGRKLDEIEGTIHFPVIARRVLDEVIQTGESYYNKEFMMPSISYHKRYYNLSIIPVNDNGQVRYITAMFENVTDKVLEREQSEEKTRIIEQQRNQFKSILENMSDGLIITDSKANILLINAAARAYFGNLDNLINLGDCYDVNNEVTDMEGNPIALDDMPAHRALRGEEVKNCRTMMKRSQGVSFLEFTSTPLFDQDGEIIMTISLCRDITEAVRREQLIKKNQEQLLKAEMERNEALEKAIKFKDEFLSLMSHEFKTPITVIISAIQAMEHICADQLSDRVRTYLNRIRQNAYRQLRLVNNLLEMARIDSGKLKVKLANHDIVFLSSSITNSVMFYANQKGISLVFSSDLEEMVMAIDDEKYERILLNLLSNAIKNTPGDHAIYVRVSKTQTPSGEMVCIEVEDEGVGIPEDKRETIFSKFSQVGSSLTRQAEGTGLGLSLVKLYVEAMDGEIALRSEVGKGSAFSVFFPVRMTEEAKNQTNIAHMDDSRLIQSVAVEFSNLYL
jgi:signal transduction histidine kinase